jgi:hypothetical protein
MYVTIGFLSLALEVSPNPPALVVEAAAIELVSAALHQDVLT